MRTIWTSTHEQTVETASHLMLAQKVKLANLLLYGPCVTVTTSRTSYATELTRWLYTVHEKVKSKQPQIRTEDRQEAPLFWYGWGPKGALKVKAISFNQSILDRIRWQGPLRIMPTPLSNMSPVVEKQRADWKPTQPQITQQGRLQVWWNQPDN